MSEPIPMRLLCPSCGRLHLDEGKWATKPHHTHACQWCGHVWRPAVADTVGVKFLPGFLNEPELQPEPAKPCPICADGVHVLPNGGCAECGFKGTERREALVEQAAMGFELDDLVEAACKHLYLIGATRGDIAQRAETALRLYNAAMEEQAELEGVVEKLRTERNRAEVALRAEMDGQVRLRKELGAKDEETFPEFVRGLASEQLARERDEWKNNAAMAGPLRQRAESAERELAAVREALAVARSEATTETLAATDLVRDLLKRFAIEGDYVDAFPIRSVVTRLEHAATTKAAELSAARETIARMMPVVSACLTERHAETSRQEIKRQHARQLRMAAVDTYASALPTCPECHGMGMVDEAPFDLFPGPAEPMRLARCPKCSGAPPKAAPGNP